MSDRDSLKIDDYRNGTDGLVRCVKCGSFIPAHATMCPDCGVHYRGHAYEFAERPAKMSPMRTVVTVGMAAIIVVIIIAAVLKVM